MERIVGGLVEDRLAGAALVAQLLPGFRGEIVVVLAGAQAPGLAPMQAFETRQGAAERHPLSSDIEN